jgi:outer membrane protein OmpA-like peptidoglycan-associated protein
MRCPAAVFAAVCSVMVSLPLVAAAQQPVAAFDDSLSVDDMVRRLKRPAAAAPAPPFGPSRGIVISDGNGHVDTTPLHNRPPLHETKSLQAMERPPADPTLRFNIRFEFGSAKLSREAQSTLSKIAQALASPDLSVDLFTVEGHTDTKGSVDYNQRLSKQRAESVRAFLMQQAGIGPARLEAVGYGPTRLADPAHPTAAINRRVEIHNLGAMGVNKG